VAYGFFSTIRRRVIRVYNTLGRSLEPLETRLPGVVTIYACGPTVQSAPHVGHGRQAVAFDVIRRYLTWRGFDVTYVVNVTDVEDKIIDAARQLGLTPAEVAERTTAQFLQAYATLGVQDADALTYATDHIAEMQDLIGRLIDKGHAYEAAGDVYFSVRSFPEYGKLSGRKVDELLAGVRIEPGDHKRDPLDFALWKASKPGEPTWDSPWGPGRPGWHIECSAMADKELGFGFDIHGGGLDLVFPHHENEIAQSEAVAADAPFARYWLHNGMVRLRGEKMAKSVGNVVGLLDLLEAHRPAAVRLFYLRAHYRQPIDYAPELVEDADASLDRMWAFGRRTGRGAAAPDSESIERFTEAMDDDFNTAEALAVLFDVIREGNRLLDSGEDADPMVAAYDEIVGVFGLEEPQAAWEAEGAEAVLEIGRAHGVTDESVEDVLDSLIALRNEARAAQDFATADELRDALAAVGVVLEDGADGTSWHRG